MPRDKKTAKMFLLSKMISLVRKKTLSGRIKKLAVFFHQIVEREIKILIDNFMGYFLRVQLCIHRFFYWSRDILTHKRPERLKAEDYIESGTRIRIYI
jgi:hypothetical protein